MLSLMELEALQSINALSMVRIQVALTTFEPLALLIYSVPEWVNQQGNLMSRDYFVLFATLVEMIAPWAALWVTLVTLISCQIYFRTYAVEIYTSSVDEKCRGINHEEAQLAGAKRNLPFGLYIWTYTENLFAVMQVLTGTLTS